MADNVTANAGSGGAVFATDDVGGVHYPISKLAFGALDSVTLVELTAGLPVNVATATSLTIGTALPTGTNIIGGVNLGTLTAPLNVVGAGAEATALRVTIATDSSGVITVDGTVAVSTVDSITNVVNVAAVAAVSTLTSVTNVVNVAAVAALSTVTSVTNVAQVSAVSTVTSVTNVAAVAAATVSSVQTLASNAIDRSKHTIAASLACDNLYRGTVDLEVVHNNVVVATTAATEILPGNALLPSRLVAMQCVALSGTNAVSFQDTDGSLYASTANPIPLDVTGATGPAGLTLPFMPVAWMKCATGSAIEIVAANANPIAVIVAYVEG